MRVLTFSVDSRLVPSSVREDWPPLRLSQGRLERSLASVSVAGPAGCARLPSCARLTSRTVRAHSLFRLRILEAVFSSSSVCFYFWNLSTCVFPKPARWSQVSSPKSSPRLRSFLPPRWSVDAPGDRDRVLCTQTQAAAARKGPLGAACASPASHAAALGSCPGGVCWCGRARLGLGGPHAVWQTLPCQSLPALTRVLGQSPTDKMDASVVFLGVCLWRSFELLAEFPPRAVDRSESRNR